MILCWASGLMLKLFLALFGLSGLFRFHSFAVAHRGAAQGYLVLDSLMSSSLTPLNAVVRRIRICNRLLVGCFDFCFGSFPLIYQTLPFHLV